MAVRSTIHTDSEQPFRPWTWTTNESGPYTMTRLRRCSVRWYRHLSTKLQRPVLLTPLGRYYPAGIASTRRFIAIEETLPLFKIHALRLTLFRSRFSLKHLPYSGVPFRHCRRDWHDAIRIRKLQRSPTTWQLYRCGTGPPC
jgi:hypothetical protein